MVKVYINDPNDVYYVSKLEMSILPRIGETIIIDYDKFYKVTGIKYYISEDELTVVTIMVDKIQ